MMSVRRSIPILVLALVACEGKEEEVLPPAKLPASRVDLPPGTSLLPFDAARPGKAGPEGLVMAENKKLYAALTNLRDDYAPAGPGLLAEIDPASGETALIDLGADCTNAQGVAARGTKVYATCTADYVNGKLAIFDTSTRQVTRVAVGGGPWAIAVGDDGTVFLGNSGYGPGIDCDADGTTAWDEYLTPGTVDVVSPSGVVTHSAASGQVVACAPSCDARWGGIGDLRVVGGDLYVACLGTDQLARLDPTDMRVKSVLAVGDGPQALAPGLGGKILVANSIAGTLSVVTPATDGSMTVERDKMRLGDVSNDVEVRGNFAYVVSSGFHTVQKIDLATFKTVEVLSTLPRSNPWAIALESDTAAWVTNYQLGALVKIEFRE